MKRWRTIIILLVSICGVCYLIGLFAPDDNQPKAETRSGQVALTLVDTATPPPPTETPTPIPATVTLGPTHTPTETYTPAPPTQTPTASNTPTPIPPTTTPTASNTPTPVPPTATPTPTHTATPIVGPRLIITGLYKKREFVTIENIGSEPQDLAGWRLFSERGAQDCYLWGVVEPGQTLFIWAMAENVDEGGFNLALRQTFGTTQNRMQPFYTMLMGLKWPSAMAMMIKGD